MNSEELNPVPNQWDLGNSESKKINWITKSDKIKSGRLTTGRRDGKVYVVYYDADGLMIGVEELI